MRFLFLFAFFFFVCFSSCFSLTVQAAYPEPERAPIPYNSDERFKVVGGGASEDGSFNVEIEEVSRASLPPFIAGQVDTIKKTCADKVDDSAIKIYTYISDRTRKKKLAPDYLIDLTGLKMAKIKSCIVGQACTKNGCLLLGYGAHDDESWNRSFRTWLESWRLLSIKESGRDTERTVFHITSHGSCEAPTDGEDPDISKSPPCEKDYVWYGARLLPFKPHETSGGETDSSKTSDENSQ